MIIRIEVDTEEKILTNSEMNLARAALGLTQQDELRELIRRNSFSDGLKSAESVITSWETEVDNLRLERSKLERQLKEQEVLIERLKSGEGRKPKPYLAEEDPTDYIEVVKAEKARLSPAQKAGTEE